MTHLTHHPASPPSLPLPHRSFSRRTSTSSISSELDDKAAELGTASAAAAAATGRAGKTGKPKSKRRLVLSVLVFEEFLEELAALSLEHSVR